MHHHKSEGTYMLGLFSKRTDPRKPRVLPNGVTMGSQSPGAALYVDTENLQNSAQALVETIIGEWPEEIPPLSRLNLYVQADRVSLWDVWASSQFPSLTVTVRGIQHFTSLRSKNSADIAIAIDAVADFVMGTNQFVAVMSDDSDFIPLYAKLKDLDGTRVPFLWLMTDRTKTKASTIADFFPNEHIHVVRKPYTSTLSSDASDEDEVGAPLWPEVADLIIREMPVGSFKSVECQPFIRRQWPNHPMASMPGPQFGTEFANRLWPILEKRGAKISKTKPRKYEITSKAKNAAPQARNAGGQEVAHHASEPTGETRKLAVEIKDSQT